MELKLNIYNENDEIVKTYTRDTYSIKMRLFKEIIETLNLDEISKQLKSKSDDSNIKLVELVANFVRNSYDTVQNLMKRVFPGLTDEEYLDTNLSEVILVVKNLILNSISTISLASSSQKN